VRQRPFQNAKPLTPHPDKHITFHPFADGGVLHRTGSHRLWVLNVTAAALWCLIDGQSDNSQLARDYGTRFGIENTVARRDVDALLVQFRYWGLLDGGTPEDPHSDAQEPPLEPLRTTKRLETDISGLPRVAFTLAGHCFTVTFSDGGMASGWEALFTHLVSDEKPGWHGTALAILEQDAREGRCFFCYENGIGTEGGLARNQVVPYLIYKLFAKRMAGLQHRLLFHAGVVAKNGQALLLPAPSGSGQSTLAAALSASGWTYLSDELAVVDPATLCVEPFALPIGLKDKSMDALAPFIPAVEDLPRHIRMDGIGVRYHRPAEVTPEGCLPIRTLVYPQYNHDAATRLTELPPLDSLDVLAATGSSARPLVSSDVRAMLKMASLPSYRLEFSDLGQAISLINNLDI
jgi:hypothetical protein